MYFSLNKLQFSILDNNKGFMNICFLQKLKWMETEWDQARVKSTDMRSPIHMDVIFELMMGLYNYLGLTQFIKLLSRI